MSKKIIIYIPSAFIKNQQVVQLLTYVKKAQNGNLENALLIIEPTIKTSLHLIKNLSFQSILITLALLGRKIIPVTFFGLFEQRERFRGKLINIITLNYFYADYYITVSNAMGGIFRGINPKARVLDYQHGIIPSTQPGFFENGQIADRIKSNNKEVLVYGPGFKDIFMKVDPNYSAARVHVIGAFDDETKKFIFEGTNILVTLQIIETEPRQQKWFKEQENLLIEQLEGITDSAWKDKVTVYIKPHPRSNGTYDLSKVLAYPFVKPYDDSVTHFILHLTYYSTSAFDVAQSGIPTLFLYSPYMPEGKQVFLEEFGYPFPNPLSAVEWLEDLADESFKDKIEKGVLNWYERFYAPFDENLFIKLFQ